MPFNPDGSWTSPVSGKTYPKDTPRSEISDEDNAALSEDLKADALTAPNPVGDGDTQSNPFASPTIDDDPGARLETGAADEQRKRQQDFIARLQQQATTGDGAWRQTFMQAVQQGQANASALGQADANTDYGSSLDNIGNAQAGVRQRAVGEEQRLRAQSQLDARGQMADMLGLQGQGDIAQSQNAAAVRQGSRQTQAALDDQSRQNTVNTISGIGQAIPFVGGGISAAANAGYSEGGKVPGKAVMGGDDPVNDTQPAMLSPGEIVVPRSVVGGSPEEIARFVAAVKAQGGAQGLAGGGLLGGPDRQVASVDNGGLLDTSQYRQTAGQMDSLAELFAGQAAGSGPSIAPVMLQRSTDDTLGAGLAAQTRGGVPASDVTKAAGAVGAETAGNVGRQAAVEQSQGQGAYARAVQQRRAQEMQLAQAQQQAAWGNSQLNAGVTLKDQALLRGIASGAGQATTNFASMGNGQNPGGNYSGPYQEDYGGERGGPADLSASDPDFKAFGGVVGMAEGGLVARDPATGRKLESTADVAAREAAAEERAKRKALEHEEETGEKAYVARKAAEHAEEEDGGTPVVKPAAQPSAFARAVRGLGKFAVKAAGSVRGMADGGVVPSDASGYPMSSDAGTPMPSMFPYTPPQAPVSMPAPPSPSIRDQLIPKGSGLDKMMQAPPGYDPVLGVGLSAPAVAARQSSPELPAGVVKKGAAPVEAPKPEAAPTPKAKGIGIAVPSGVAPNEAALQSEEQAAIDAATEAERAKAKAQVEGAAAKADAMEQAQLRRQEVEARAKQEVSDARAKFEAAQSEMARIDTSVDPGRFWASRSTGDKVVATIGLIFGALGSGNDGINRAAVLLNQAIDRDLEAQKAEHSLRLEKGKSAVNAAQTYYSMARATAQDDLAAADWARAAALESAAAKAEQMVAATGDQTAKAKGMGLAAELHRAAADRKASGDQRVFENRLKAQHLANETNAASAKGPNLPAAEQTKALEVKERTGNIRRDIAKAKAIIQRSGTMELLGTDETELKRLLGDIAQDSARLKDPNSTVKEQELENAKKAIGVSGGEIFTRNSTALKLLDSYEKQMVEREREALRVRGLAQ